MAPVFRFFRYGPLRRRPRRIPRTPEIEALTRRAREVIPPRVAYYAAQMGVTYGRVTIRHQASRWGSCSAKGNLNFNCLLMLAPEPVRDGVIIHELCHRKVMDHSPRFWAEVSRYCPDYKACRRWLREEGAALLKQALEARVPGPDYL